jgi:hypothetical protein
MKSELWTTALALGGATVALTAAWGTEQMKESAFAPVTTASLVGTWTLTAADDLNPDGTRVHAYGSNPKGLLIFDADGRYSVQIFREDRLKFASGDKHQGTPEEYKDASLGMSSHFGHYAVNTAKQTLTFTVDRASFPNWDGASQTRPFTLKNNDLEWHVPATPDGKTPISAWHRVR